MTNLIAIKPNCLMLIACIKKERLHPDFLKAYGYYFIFFPGFIFAIKKTP